MRAAILFVLAGCFGEGPSPGTPKNATTLFALELSPLQEDDCQPHPYIGNVALGADAGYLVTHAYLPACTSSGGDNGGNQRPIPSSVFEFDKRGGSSMKIGDAGTTTSAGGSRARIAAIGSDAVWMFTDPMIGTATVRSKSTQIAGTFVPMTESGAPEPASIVIDANAIYVAIGPQQLGPAVNAPNYPCCGPNNMNRSTAFVQLPKSSTITASTPLAGTPPMFFIAQMKEVLVANSSALFYVEHAAPVARVAMQPKSGGAAEQIAMLASQPAGLAVDDVNVAWSTTVDFTMSSASSRSCSIFVTTIAPPRTETMLLSTTAFSCFDLALDGDHVYFTMVEHTRGEFSDLVRSVGIGRVQLSTKNVETIDLGMPGPQAAPRQLFVDGDGIIVVAPFAIARIAKAELDGKLDVAP